MDMQHVSFKNRNTKKKKKRDHKVEYRHLTPISGIMSDIRILNDQFLRWFQPSGTHTTLA